MLIYVTDNRIAEKFISCKVFCVFLVDVLRRHVHPSIDVYIAKNSGRINWTSCVNLERFSYEVVQIAEHHVFHWMYERKFDYVMRSVENFWLDLFHQKGKQYGYILFDLA